METNKPKTRLGLEIEQKTKNQLREKAKQKGLTLSGYTRMIIKENLE